MRTTETDSLALPPGELRMASLPRMTVVRHPEPDRVGIGQTLARTESYTIGRSGSLLSGIFEQGKVSREHARAIVGERVTLTDLGSRNGTFINGGRIHEATVLEEGDVIGLGPVLLLFHRGPRHHREPDHPRLWGVSHPLADLVAQLEEAGPRADNVVLVGETGTGKELAARALHEVSGREGPFVALNCAAVADGVIPSELFGHERGAFSGAEHARDGLIAAADGGTLFLDELAAASPKLQAALLRVLEDPLVRPVGATAARPTDVRFVAAVQEGDRDLTQLRDDLWFRLARHRIQLPPLRHRRVDISVLAQRFASVRQGSPVRLGRALALALLRHDWPGNVRELHAVIEQLMTKHPPTLVPGGFYELDAAPEVVSELVPLGRRKDPAESRDEPRRRRQASRQELEAALQQTEGQVTHAAKRLGVARRTLYRWLDAHDIDPAIYRPDAP